MSGAVATPAQEALLAALVRRCAWLETALRAARTVDLPSWLIGGGALRGAVWDQLHGRPPALPRDIDLAFFDAADPGIDRDREATARLLAVAPDLPWEATNQAGVHRWYHETFGGDPIPPLTSTADGVGTWPETATAVGIRLEAGGDLTIVAPHGLDDLLGLVHRRNPRLVTPEQFAHRLATRRIGERWPGARIVAT